jgi:hypothetical protein
MKPNQLRFWRAVNTAVVALAMFMPWYYSGSGVEGNAPPKPIPYFEWLYAIQSIKEFALVRISHGLIDEITIDLILRGVSAVLLLLYLAYNLLVLVTKKKGYQSRNCNFSGFSKYILCVFDEVHVGLFPIQWTLVWVDETHVRLLVNQPRFVIFRRVGMGQRAAGKHD